MPTVSNLPNADINVILPSGKTITVFMPRLLAQTLNAEFKAKYDMFLPNVGKLHPTVKAVRDEYEIPMSVCLTWADAAKCLRRLHTDLKEAQTQGRVN